MTATADIGTAPSAPDEATGPGGAGKTPHSAARRWLTRLWALPLACVPVVFYGWLLLTPYEPRWFLSEQAPLYDLLLATVMQLFFVVAIFLLFRRRVLRVLACTILANLFIGYQVLTWGGIAHFNAVVDRVPLADGTDLLMIYRSGGGFTSTSVHSLVVSEPVALLLRRERSIAGYRKAGGPATGKILSLGADGVVTVRLLMGLDNRAVVERFTLPRLAQCMRDTAAWRQGQPQPECKPDK